jgi:ketosteroid isomerase-like protein
MNLPDFIAAFVKAHNAPETTAYVACFTPDAIVFDEGKNHLGREEIKAWKRGCSVRRFSERLRAVRSC